MAQDGVLPPPGSAPSRRLQVTLPLDRIHRHIGIGGDELLEDLRRVLDKTPFSLFESAR
jgi:hypothetical protein